MKVKRVTKLIEKFKQYDISTATENFYVRVGNVFTLIHNSPSIFAGNNPENGKFFVGTKGVFAQNAKLNYTPQDIDNNHPGEGLNKKLKIALQYLQELDIQGVIQGDMMFTAEDLKTENIDNKDCIIFQPNTIVYAVPTDSTLAKQIRAAKLGVVWHTSYTGKTLPDMKASFGVNIGRLRQTKNVWFRDASFVDATGAAAFSKQETSEVTAILSQAGALFRQISPNTLNQIATNDTYKIEIKAWNNLKVREGKEIDNTSAHVQGLILKTEEKLNRGILDAKKSDTRDKRIKEKNIILGFYRANKQQLKMIFDLQNLLVKAKLMIVRRLQQVKDIGTFIKTDTGFRVTSPEGFVAISAEGKAVKLIDRLEFSQENFNAVKNWTN